MDPRDTERSFLELYEASADAVFRHLCFKVRDRELARDLTQESFTRAWSYLSEGKKIDNLKAFVFRTANNLVIDYYRKKKEASLDALADAGFDPSDDAHERIVEMVEARQAYTLINDLSDEHREVVILRYASGLSVGEIAKTLGESENTVSVRLHRALAKLRTLFNHEPSN